MLGLRGVRLLTVLPEILDVQVRALAEASPRCRAEGRDVRARRSWCRSSPTWPS